MNPLGPALVVQLPTIVVAVTVVRRRDLTGAARWAFAGLAVVAVLSVVLPVALAVQALALIVVGVLFLLQGRSPGTGGGSRVGV